MTNRTKDVNAAYQAGELPSDPTAEDGVPLGTDGAPSMLRKLDLDGSLARIQRRKDGKEKPIALPWASAHEQFGGGLWPGLHVVVGGTGAGKSTFALQCALTAAKAGHPVAYVGLELDSLQIDCRLIALEAGLEWSKLYLGKHEDNDAEHAKIKNAVRVLGGLPIRAVFPEAKGWPASKLSDACELLAEEFGKDKHPLIVLDYLQMLGNEEGQRMELRERVGNAAIQARLVARKHDASVLVLSSTARGYYGIVGGYAKAINESGLSFDGTLDAREKNRMTQTWLVGADELVGVGKESGDVEFAADSVSVLIRDPSGATGDRATMVLATPKGRATGPGWCALSFNGTRFDDAPAARVKVYQHFQDEKSAQKKEERTRAKSGKGQFTPPSFKERMGQE